MESFGNKINIVRRSSFLSYSWLLMMSTLAVSYPLESATEKVEIVPRTVLAFYDSVLDESLSYTESHKAAEMPLNHLGLVVKYQDIHDPLPNEQDMLAVRGILLWFTWNSMPDPDAFIKWMVVQMHAGLKVVIMGTPAFENIRAEEKTSADPELIKRFWDTFGMSSSPEWIELTYGIKLEAMAGDMTHFERPFGSVPPAFPARTIKDENYISYLTAYRPGHSESLADLIVTGPKGGYAWPNYNLTYLQKGKLRFWYLNPFRFFREAFATDDLPKADTTTLSGRRIYYSHVDGDGWRSMSLIPEYKEKRKTVSEVLLREVFERYPDLPVTVAPVAVDLTPGWPNTKTNQAIAKEIFALPHVQAGSHTHSHPLDWLFFEDYTLNEELPYMAHYPKQDKQNKILTTLGFGSKQQNGYALATDHQHTKKSKVKKLKLYDRPRAYFTGQFDINQEIQGSVDVIQQFLPEGKQIELLQWSGNTLPFDDVIKQARIAGLRNLNGGDTRLDRKYDSFAWVFPVGRQVGNQRQIYSSASNENSYTDSWTKRFYSFAYLEQTFRRTETPWRIKPINIYYHNYSGERLASLNALHKNFTYAQSQQIAPVTASHFAAIGDSFYSTNFEKTGDRQWRIKNRDQMQTIRFDNATFDAVDFARSQGVTGQSHLHGSLYVHLAPEEQTPVIALKEIEYSDREPDAERPYLISGRWQTKNLRLLNRGFVFDVQGFGAGDMDWYMPEPGNYRVTVNMANGQNQQWESTVGDDHWLNIELEAAPIKPLNISVEAVQVGNESA